jgi:hypothetical protein
MKIYNCATEIRSKNAGPFLLTIDIILPNRHTLRRVLDAPNFCPKFIAGLYGVPSASVHITQLESVMAVKVTMPNPDGSSGSPMCRDVYGSQQHFPLANIELEP